MPRSLPIVRVVVPLVAFCLVGCGSGADLVAPTDNINPTQSCTIGTPGQRASSGCSQISLAPTPGYLLVQRL